MSLFDSNNKPGADDNRLREWGNAERGTPPAWRGSFASLASRLTRRGVASPTDTPVSWLRPALAMGLATCISVSVAVGTLGDIKERQQAENAEAARAVVMARSVSKSRGGKTNEEVYQANRKREAAAKRKNLGAWNGRALLDVGNGVSARCAPVFVDGDTASASVGKRGSAVVPFSVAIKNTGAAFGGTITVEVGEGGMDRTYRYPVRIAGNGATFRQTLYPRLDQGWSSSQYRVTLQTPFKTVVLDTGKATEIGANTSYDGDYNRPERTVAILDIRIGVLSPRFGRSGTDIGTLYAKPGFAPDRAVGYDAVDMLVLGHGCETLTPAQWSAIKAWVKDGGSLVMLGGSPEMRRVLATPAALALSPAQALVHQKRSRLPLHRVSYLDSSEPLLRGYCFQEGIAENFPATITTIPVLKPDARVVEQSPVRGETKWLNIAAKRTLGAGAVSLYGYDLTSDAYRDDPGTLPGWWVTADKKGKGAFPASRWSHATSDFWGSQGSDRSQTPGLNNPFYTQFPDLSLVMYVFLGYFVLVVPVSFVVLKQTRRMHYAWFTAPALAAVCAGGLAFTTRDLYKAPQSVRTSGMIALEAGDPVARFHGVSELYTPKSGRYPLNLAGTHQAFGTGETYGYQHDNQADIYSVKSIADNGTGEAPPDVEMGNLSFRRINHDQTVTLGTGITANLCADKSGNVIGTITNGTGQTLRNVSVYLRGEDTYQGAAGAEFVPMWRYDADTLAPGTRRITLYPSAQAPYSSPDMDWNTRLFNEGTAVSFVPRTPFLVAHTDGKAFAPQGFGQWVGGNESVQVIAKLPAVPQALMPKTFRSDVYQNPSGATASPNNGATVTVAAPVQGDNR